MEAKVPFPFTKRGGKRKPYVYIHAWWLTKHELTGRPKLDGSTRKLQVHLDNVKGPSVRAKPPPPLPTPPWNIAPVPRAQLGIYHSRLLTDPARNSSSPSRLGTAHPGGGVFTVAYDSWAYFHHGSEGRGGGTQENPFPTNVQFSCWRLVERIERGYPFPANRPGPQLVLPRSVFLSSLNEPSVVDRSTRNLCENLRCWAIDSIRKNDRLIISVTKLLWLFIGGFGSVLYEVITFVE